MAWAVAISSGLQCMAQASANSNGVPAMYPTQAEAEAAAKKHFNCTGAHQMGKQWMPCSKHGQAEQQH
jgi:hypothetical protein